MLSAYTSARVFRVVALGALVAAALLCSYVRSHARNPVRESRTARFSGVLLAAHADGEGGSSYTFAIDRGPRTLVSLPDLLPSGSRVVIRGRLEPLDGARNPGETSERVIEGEHGIDARLESAHLIAVLGGDSSWQAALARVRATAHAALQTRLGEPAASIVAGELWGERAQLPPDLRAEFQESGTVHVLVTAGLHVGLVALVVAWCCAQLRAPRLVACGAGIVAVWAFAAFSGLELPALRAATMATCALAARACGRAAFSWNTLILAAAVVIAAIPGSVAAPSFWLSFCCVGAIFALGGTIDDALHDRVILPHRVREALVLTLATQLGTWPITAAIFLQWSSYALVANLAVVPCVPLTMLLGAAQLALGWCAPLAQACANINGWIIAWTIGVVRTLGALPAASVVMTPAPLWCIALYECALLAAAPLMRRGGATPALAFALTATALVLWPPQAFAPQLKITVLDVGQADAIVIETPAHHAILVDAGGRLERGAQGDDSVAERVGERIVVPFLIREGIHQLDALIVSHPHGDHVGGCSPVLRKLRVAEIADSGQTYGGHAYHDCLDTAHAERVPIVYPRAGEVWRTGDGVTLQFIGPQLPFVGGRNAINENSIAFILTYRRFRMLFTGDAGSLAEQRFLDEGIDLHADVLKVGHHGSAYGSSPAFITAVHPRYAIISVGRHNIFGHPAPSTIETLERAGAQVYRTDENGATIVTSDGDPASTVVTEDLALRADDNDEQHDLLLFD
ncbi:MAG TPA: DNA internalization-related competence protein ComEC/Rec2 [Candidatus Baltobacteraceae bacterium]|nr:DNA internalization-related competence protein ComEC/Rec2 [Candidatus Baltobacteraceae bacterium]